MAIQTHGIATILTMQPSDAFGGIREIETVIVFERPGIALRNRVLIRLPQQITHGTPSRRDLTGNSNVGRICTATWIARHRPIHNVRGKLVIPFSGGRGHGKGLAGGIHWTKAGLRVDVSIVQARRHVMS
jgi:hypothetical protein